MIYCNERRVHGEAALRQDPGREFRRSVCRAEGEHHLPRALAHIPPARTSQLRCSPQIIATSPSSSAPMLHLRRRRGLTARWCVHSPLIAQAHGLLVCSLHLCRRRSPLGPPATQPSVRLPLSTAAATPLRAFRLADQPLGEGTRVSFTHTPPTTFVLVWSCLSSAAHRMSPREKG